MEDTQTPTLHEVSLLKEDWGLVGEESTHLTLFLCFLGGSHVVVTGLSSGGKDATVYSVEYCFPDDWVFNVPTSLSKTDLYTRALNSTGSDNPNNCPVHRHKDISNLTGKEFLEDMWKAHGDDRSITHSWTEVMGQERESRSATINPPNCMVLFLASDNDQMDINDYAEVRNRLLVVSIDDSQELTEKVNTRQARQRSGRVTPNLSEERTEEIREYVGSIPWTMYASESGSGSYVNPLGEAIDMQNPLPQHFTEARRDFPRLMDFVESVSLFHYDDRLEIPENRLPNDRNAGMVNLAVAPADAWLGMRIFGEKMVLSALNLRDKDFVLLKILRDADGRGMSSADLQMAMRDNGFNITQSDVRTAMNNMLTKGYVKKDQTASPIMYSSTPFAVKARRKVNMDWPQIIDDTREIVHDTYTPDVAVEYEEEYLEGDGLLVTHPFTGKTVNLLDQEANELEDEVNQREDLQDDIATGDDDPDDGQGALQGTLQ
jgi:hypothetical protein